MGRILTTITSGIENLDDITGGFQPGELVLICGRPGMGKSSLLDRMILNTAHTAVRDKKPEFVLYFSMEKLTLSGIPRFRGIRNLQEKAVIVDNTPCISAGYIAEKYAAYSETHKISLLAIDYLQLMKLDNSVQDNRRQQTTAIVSSLKELARREQVCIMLTSRLSRHVDKRPDHVPQLSDLSFIGDIEALADMAILLHRPYHVVGMQGTPLELLPGPTTVTIAKNRHGGTGTCELPIREFGKSEMDYWVWKSNSHQIAAELREGMQRKGARNMFLIPEYERRYFSIRSHLRWFFFGSPDFTDGPRPDNYQNSGYVINGFRMDDTGFARLNASLRWQIAADDPVLDYDLSENLHAAFSPKPEQYNAFCPLDGYVTAVNAEYHWRLPTGEHISESGPDHVYRLCPHCLMELASRMVKMR